MSAHQRQNNIYRSSRILSQLRIFSESLLRPQRVPRYVLSPVMLQELKLPRMFKTCVMFSGCTLFVFFAWASFTHVDETINATGQVIPRGHVQAVQHLEGGIIKDIFIEDGQLVEKGQHLMRLDNTTATSELGQILARKTALTSEAIRLRRFTSLSVSSKIEKFSDEDRAILHGMEQARETQRQVLKSQILQKEKDLATLQSARSVLEKNIYLIEKENTIRQNLAKKGYGSQLMAIASQREFNEAQGKINETTSLETRAQEAANEAYMKLQSLNADLRQQALKKLGDIDAQLAEIASSLTKFESASVRTMVTSPAKGFVKGLGIHTLGAVVEPGKLLLEIVPVETPLIVEAIIAPQDIGRLREGAKAKIKVSAYDYARYGYATGLLQNVSATTFQTQDSKTFYKAKIILDQPSVGDPQKKHMLLPGMTVEASILTGEKSVLQYLLKPVYTTTEGAFHEH